MALFDKLLSIKRKLVYVNRGSQNRDRSSQINPGQVRLLLFKECDRRGRKLLFDSSTIERVPASKNDKPNIKQTSKGCILEVSEGFSYIYNGAETDACLLGEMIFGAVAMNYKNVSLKIHIMDEPKRLMCTKVFCVPTNRRVSRVERRQEDGTSTDSMTKGTRPLSVPRVTEDGVSLSFSIERGDSGFYGEHSPYSSVGSTYDYVSKFDVWDGNNTQEDFYTFRAPSGRRLSTSSNGSWHRRTFQNMATRFDLSNSNLLNLPQTSSNVTSIDSQGYSNSSTTDSLTSTGSSMTQRRSKLGLALLFTVANCAEMDLVSKCVENSPQLQALVSRLRIATLAAGAGGGFVSTLHRATCDAARWLQDLVYGPRLQPVWLSLVSRDAKSSTSTAESLLADLCSVLAVGDTKQTNFFISTLVTHVLTYHLGWVPTVSPYDTVESHNLPAESTDTQKPYNALWAQLSDLCGSIGFPPRAARTIISGSTNAQFVQRLLVVLTYFLRCGDVTRCDFEFQGCVVKETKVVNVKQVDSFEESVLNVPSSNTQSSDSANTLVASEGGFKRSTTLAKISQQLSSSPAVAENNSLSAKPSGLGLRRNTTTMMPLRASSDTSLSSGSDEVVEEKNVLFVLGENEKLVGLKNRKSNDGKSVKRSSKANLEPVKVEEQKEDGAKENHERSSDSPSKCCGQTLQHSKPIKHSGFKFEFDKYPQIVTNYMKSKNLEILDRHYIGKPGNLKLDNFQFDPTIVPDWNSFQEEKCETCYKCQFIESTLQTPTNASEMEYMNDIPRQSEPQFAKQTIAEEESSRDISPKNFVRNVKENTLVVNPVSNLSSSIASEVKREERRKSLQEKRNRLFKVHRVLEFPLPAISRASSEADRAGTGFNATLLGGVTDHYVPDLVLQGTVAKSNVWEADLRRDLDLTSYLNKIQETPLQTVAIIGDTNTWEVRVLGHECGAGGMSSLVGAMLDVLPAMWRARVPAHQCLSFLEGKLREFCVLSKTLADMLMSTDFCDIATVTRSLNIDVNDVPLLLAVATTHTPQVAARYGISYR